MKTRLVLAAIGALAIAAACGRVSPGTAPALSPGASPTQSVPLTISTVTIPAAEVSLKFGPVVLTATGGVPPYKWSLRDPSLPPGLALASDGTISGTPTEAGAFTGTILVSDSRPKTATTEVSFAVAPKLTASPIRSTTTAVKLGLSGGQFGSQTGGLAPFTYSVTSGALPPGTTLNGLALAGTFTVAGTHTFTTTVVDSLGATADVSAAYYVFPGIAFQAHSGPWDASCSGRIDTGCSAQVPFSGGTPGVAPVLSWSTADTALNPVPVPTGASGQVDLVPPSVSGGAVNFTFAADRLGSGGGLPWTGVVIVTLTDPSTGESTTAHIFVNIYHP